jgi:hypothetical protein
MDRRSCEPHAMQGENCKHRTAGSEQDYQSSALRSWEGYIGPAVAFNLAHDPGRNRQDKAEK